MSIIVSDVSYHYCNQQSLFEHTSFSVASNSKVSIIGNNGTGKSTLLKLLAGELRPSYGAVCCSSEPYYIPQQVGIITGQSVSDALSVARKIYALRSICNGSSDQIHYDRLADDWDVESRCRSALDYWGLTDIDLNMSIDLLSGGEKTKVFLAGLQVHEPDVILLDEPTNHLDHTNRQKLYDFISGCKATVVVVSHDITLLNRLDTTYELSEKGIKLYGGNYAFYKEQKEIEERALSEQISSEESSLRLARKKVIEVKERHNKRVRRGEKDSSGIPRIAFGRLQEKGENTGARLSEKHAAIIADSQQKLTELRQRQQFNGDLKIDFDNARLHNGKLLMAAVGVNFEYVEKKPLWQTALNIEIRSGERVHIKGDNGSGKTILIGLLTGKLTPSEGEVRKENFSYVYLDQQYNEANRVITILELAQMYNRNNLLDHEIKLRLNRALFPKDAWDKSCLTLSGGERMRLYLCCLMISNHLPDLFILDEPTNNLDLSSLSILTDTIRYYRGTLLVISHDRSFIDEIGITRCIELKAGKQPY